MRANNIINYYTFQLKRRDGFARRERNRLNLVRSLGTVCPAGALSEADRQRSGPTSTPIAHWLGGVCELGARSAAFAERWFPRKMKEK